MSVPFGVEQLREVVQRNRAQGGYCVELALEILEEVIAEADALEAKCERLERALATEHERNCPLCADGSRWGNCPYGRAALEGRER